MGGQNLSPCVAGGTMGAGHFSQFEFISVAEGKPSQPGWRPWKCTPIGACGTTSPEGEVCSPLGLCSHKNRDGKHRANLPHRGRCRRQKGCISIGPKARFACFPSPDRAVVWFYQTGAEGAHRHPLNPLNLVNPLNPHARRACPLSLIKNIYIL